MYVSGNSFPHFAGASLRIGSIVAATRAAPPAAAPGRSLRDFAELMVGLRDAHGELVTAGERLSASARTRNALVAGSPLTLSTGVATTLRSTEEVNAIATSYGTSSPAFGGLSTSDPTIGGTYSGDQGDTTLTFTSTVGGVVGTTPVSFEVRDAEDELVDTIDLGFDSPGTVYTLSNGLEVSFSSGTVVSGDSFELEVSSSVGSSVRPDNAFDESGDDGPNFEPGLSVGAGSFDVNGITITVAADDTLNDVLASIEASGAGVTAAFDEDTETILLTRTDLGPDDITLENDTSGFLAATKLDAASAALGTIDETTAVIADVASLSTISSGTFEINGVAVTVDVLNDSIDDLLERINSSGAGVTASYDPSTGELGIQADDSSDLVLQDGTSNFLSVFGLEDGTFQAEVRGSTARFGDREALARSLDRLAQAHAALFEGTYSGFGSSTIARMRTQLGELVETVFESVLDKTGTGTLRSGLGLDFVTKPGASRTLELDESRLSRALQRDPDELAELLFAEREEDGHDGLIPALEARLEQALGTLATFLGSEAAGLGLDVRG